MSLDLQSHELGVVLPVCAQPGASRNAVLGAHHGMLKVAVTQAPEKGKANKALIDVLSKSLDLKRSQLELLSGETQREKKFLVKGRTLEELQQALALLLNGC